MFACYQIMLEVNKHKTKRLLVTGDKFEALINGEDYVIHGYAPDDYTYEVPTRVGYNLSGIDTTKYSVDLLKAVGVKFPEVHGIFITFKETSFCKKNLKAHPTFCQDSWEHIVGVDWNPYNPSGMKHPWKRPTTAISTVGQMLLDFTTKYDVELNRKYRYFIYDKNGNIDLDPHAVYASYVDHAIDIKMYQEWYFKVQGYVPQTAQEYISFLQECGYNPYDKYYRDLRRFYAMWKQGEFRNMKACSTCSTYGELYYERMGLQMPYYKDLY